MTIVPLNNACPPAGGVFNVTIRVTAIADALGGSYDAYIYASTIGFDTILDSKPANGVARNMAGRPQRFTHAFTLKCDQNCDIEGNSATSGNNPCDVYAYVSVPNNPAVNDTSRTLTLSCTGGDDERQPQQQQETSKTRKK